MVKLQCYNFSFGCCKALALVNPCKNAKCPHKNRHHISGISVFLIFFTRSSSDNSDIYQNGFQHCYCVLTLKLFVVGKPVDQLHHQWLKQLPRHLRKVSMHKHESRYDLETHVMRQKTPSIHPLFTA